jgi:hypothetical protein
MKLLMILGGLLGFLISIAIGLAEGTSWQSLMWRASVVAYVSGLLFRWWGRVWFQGLRQIHQERLAQRAANDNSSPTTRPKT